MAKPGKYIMALDQGTTSSRAIVFDEEGTVVGAHQIPFTQIFPKPGWVEHDPEEIWATQLAAAKGALVSAKIAANQVEALGITNQRETTVVWDKATGKPVYNAIVWQCRRSADICQRLRGSGLSEAVRERTGLVLDPYFSGTKVAWLLESDSGLRSRAARGELAFGTIDSWLIYKMTGKHLTDPSNASRTMLFNIREGRWDEEMLEALGVPQSMLPEVVPSSGSFGVVDRDFLGVELPIAGCAGDQQAALFGHTCFGPGEVKNTYGTGCFTLLNIGAAPLSSKNNLLTTIAWDLGRGRTYALEGSVFIAGAVIQWLRDQLGLISDAAESERLAVSVDDSGEVFLVPAFVGLGAPYWDPNVRGTIVGLTRGTTKAHLVRAALESIAYQSRDLLLAMEKDFGGAIPSIKADGGATANGFLMQFQADIMDRKVILPEVQEVTALGAAYLAGLSVGYWNSLEDIKKNWKMKREYSSTMAEPKRASLVGAWNRAITAARSY